MRTHDGQPETPVARQPRFAAMLGTLRSELDDGLDVPEAFVTVMHQLESLLHQMHAKTITREQMAEALRDVKVQGPDGVLWAPGASSGAWYRKDPDRGWVRALPPAAGGASSGGYVALDAGTVSDASSSTDEGDPAEVNAAVTDPDLPAEPNAAASATGGDADDEHDDALPVLADDTWDVLRNLPEIADDGERAEVNSDADDVSGTFDLTAGLDDAWSDDPGSDPADAGYGSVLPVEVDPSAGPQPRVGSGWDVELGELPDGGWDDLAGLDAAVDGGGYGVEPD